MFPIVGNETMDPIPPERPSGRPTSSLLALLVLPLFLGCLLAPPVYNYMFECGRNPALRRAQPEIAQFFREAEFEKVTNRCVMLVALVLLIPMFRRAGLGPQIRRDLRLAGGGARDLGTACLVGCLSMLALYVFGLAIGGYVPSQKSEIPWAAAAPILGKFLAGAVFIGLFEEAFFRGFVFGALRTRLRFWPAALLASLFFAGIHFVDPRHPTGVKLAAWYESFLLVPHLFAGFEPAKYWAFATTLFAMGLTLCVLYHKRGTLWYAIGLHGGWVLAMQIGGYFLNRDHSILPWWFTSSDFVARGPIAIPVILGFLAWSLISSPARTAQPSRRTGSTALL